MTPDCGPPNSILHNEGKQVNINQPVRQKSSPGVAEISSIGCLKSEIIYNIERMEAAALLRQCVKPPSGRY